MPSDDGFCPRCGGLLEMESPAGEDHGVYECAECGETCRRPRPTVPTRNDLLVEISKILGVSISSRTSNVTIAMCNSGVAYLTGEYPAVPGLLFARGTPRKDALAAKLREEAENLDHAEEPEQFTKLEMWRLLTELRNSTDSRPGQEGSEVHTL